MLDFTGLPALVDLADIEVDGATEDMLAAVCEDVRVACGWHIAPRVADMEMVVDARGGTVLTVPSLRMGEPSSVTGASGDITGWTWSESGILEGSWPSGLRSVTVVADSGFASCPAGVKAVVVDMLRDRVSAASGGGVSQVSLDGADVTLANPYAPRGASSDVGVRRDIMDAYGHILGRHSLWDSR